MNLADHSLRFWGRVRRDSGCWEWTGAMRSTGYGLFYIKGRGYTAQRVAWALAYGANILPSHMYVCHHCDNRKCCKPSHLFIGTHSDNMRDAEAKGRMFNPQRSKTHCKRGHALPEAKLTSGGLRVRVCKPCRVIANRNQRSRAALAKGGAK